MRAIRVKDYGGAEQLELDEVSNPVPGSGDVLVRLRFSGVNFIDIYMRDGTYRRSATYAQKLPMIIGMEGAGVVESVGEGVNDFQVGDSVAYCIEPGSYAECVKVPSWKLVRVPPGVPLDVATALQLQGSTAHYLSHTLFPLKSGHRCLIHAGAGGLGQLLIQLAKIRGAEVFVTVGSEEKGDIAKARGADHVILYRETDFAEVVLDLTEGHGVDVVYDSVGKDTILGSMRCCAPRGVISNNGNASGAIGALDPLDLAEAGSIFFTRPHLADYMLTSSIRRERATDLFDLFQAGDLEVGIDRIMPLAQASKAHTLLENRQSKGKIILSTEPD